jgi:hypothetical protein
VLRLIIRCSACGLRKHCLNSRPALLSLPPIRKPGKRTGAIIRHRWVTSQEDAVNRASSTLLVLVCLASATSAAALDATQVRVRFPEGVTRGFLAIRTPQGERIGHAELAQKPRGDEVDSRLLLQFKDGSVHDERTTYSQRGVFRLEAYHLTQRGPSFPGADVAFDRKSGRYQAKTHEKVGAPEETASGEFEMPPNLANGLTLLLLKNMPRGERVTAQLAAFMPKPRLLRMELQQEGEDRVAFAGDPKQAARFLVNLEIGGVTGVVASVIGKTPPDLRYWLALGDIPAFVRFEGAMFLNGPVWRVEMAGVE